MTKKAATPKTRLSAEHRKEIIRDTLSLPARLQLGSPFRSGISVLSRDKVKELTVKTVGNVAAWDFVITDFNSLPYEIQDDVQASGAAPSEIHSVHGMAKPIGWVAVSRPLRKPSGRSSTIIMTTSA